MATSDNDHRVEPSARQGLLERGPGFRAGLRDLPRHLNLATIGAGIIAAIFGCTGPALIVIGGASAAGLSAEIIASWIFGIYFFGGLISIVMALYYQQPINGAYSIPGAALVAAALPNFSFAEMVGAFLMAGLIVLVIGMSGLVRKLADSIPFPIVMAMIAGALIRFGIDIIDSAIAAPAVVGAALVGYVVLSRFLPRVPGVLGALALGVLVAAILGDFGTLEGGIGLSTPVLVMPAFDLGAMLAVAVPLALLVIGAENAQAMGVLMAERYDPPFNMMTIISGIGGLLAPIFGGHNANIAGPMTAICSSDQAGQDPRGRYVATIVNGVIFGLFGIFAGVTVALVTVLPPELIATVAGLAMIGVLVRSFQESFSASRFQLGAFFALIIAMSGITVFNISAPFWSLIGGVLASLLLEPKDFRAREQETATAD
ncbi:benzoate/H(+) symporter BenE family transporter [Aeromicrobium sp. YIM 150415]|uniref:benzoate/H(+) symporter BenE family transporter n=1 Tax=Aeromicrobium sp. YIM 150415 TaxID=2803912 RepID=UPI0019643A32|nr:benzoate/H(+) symporter BenE family transporter [Aeromicrobium sp. YIM 150415]MBM9465016.1 benzoate/H(+) symporter BenE family transporter [Aeromicrobium sp. YIM 150415]